MPPAIIWSERGASEGENLNVCRESQVQCRPLIRSKEIGPINGIDFFLGVTDCDRE